MLGQMWCYNVVMFILCKSLRLLAVTCCNVNSSVVKHIVFY